MERLIGTLRRECLDHMVVLNETHLRRLLSAYLIYYHGARTHLSLEEDAPEPRPVERLDEGRIVETPMVGGLHHRYTRQAPQDPSGLRGVPVTLKSPVGRSVRFASVFLRVASETPHGTRRSTRMSFGAKAQRA